MSVNISAGITAFIRWFPLALFILFGSAALLCVFVAHNYGSACAFGGIGVIMSLLLFFGYSRSLCDVFIDGDRVVLTKPRKKLETAVQNIRRVEIFPDVIFRGYIPQYELIFREPVDGVKSVRLYPNMPGMKWLNELMAKMRAPAVQRRRR